MVPKQVQLHVMTNNPIKYEHILSDGFRGSELCSQRTETITMLLRCGTSVDKTHNRLLPHDMYENASCII